MCTITNNKYFILSSIYIAKYLNITTVDQVVYIVKKRKHPRKSNILLTALRMYYVLVNRYSCKIISIKLKFI